MEYAIIPKTGEEVKTWIIQQKGAQDRDGKNLMHGICSPVLDSSLILLALTCIYLFIYLSSAFSEPTTLKALFFPLHIFHHQQLVLSSIITGRPSPAPFQMTNIWMEYKLNFHWCIFITPSDFTEVFNQKPVTRMTADSVNLCRNVDETGQGSRRCLFVGCRCEGVGFRKELRRWWRLDSQHQMLSNPGWVIATTLTQRLTRFLLTSLAGKCSSVLPVKNVPWYYCFLGEQYVT